MSGPVSIYRQWEQQILAGIAEGWEAGQFEPLWLEVFRFQRRWNAPYGNFCATHREPRTWREIPAVPQNAFKQYRLSVMPPLSTKVTFRTSGTTGQAYGQHHFHNTRLYDQAILAGWERLARPKLPLLILAAPPKTTPQSSLNHMFGTLAESAFGKGAEFFLEAGGRLDSVGLTAALERHVASREPVAVLGTALAFLNVFEFLGDTRYRLPPGSFALETGGYKGSGREIPKAELYAMFGNFLGLHPDDVLNEYGMTELTSQFYTRGLGRAHAAPPWLRALVIDPETGGEVADGEPGVLRIFDLANLGSVTAIETCDLAIRREEGFELLGRDPEALPRGCSRVVDAQWQRS